MGKASVKQQFTVREVAVLSGLSETMMDYLCRQEVVLPSIRARPGRGRPRLYSFGDIVILRALRHLLEGGVGVAKLKDALRTLQRTHSEISREQLPGRFLVTDGTSVYFWSEQNILENLNAEGQTAFAFVVELAKIQKEVRETLAARGQ